MIIRQRFLELDAWRGSAVVGMVAFHSFFILDYFGLREAQINSGFWLVLGHFVRFSFLLLVGIVMVIAYEKDGRGNFAKRSFRQWKRAAFIMFLAILISVVTFMTVGEQYVRFGILHLIAVSIFVLSFLFLLKNKYYFLLMAILSFFVGIWLKNFESDNLLLFILGVPAPKISTLDYFPIFPWLAVVSFGAFLGYFLYPKEERSFKINLPENFWLSNFLIFLGQKSLFIYVVHVPIILLLVFLISILPLPNFF